VVTDPFFVEARSELVEPAVELPGEMDSVEAAIYLNTTLNNVRQLIHKKQLTVIRKQNRRAVFKFAEVHELEMIREFNRQKRAK
jgi:hypothetical protein